MDIFKFNFISELNSFVTGADGQTLGRDNLGLEYVYQPATGSNYLNRIIAIIEDENGAFIAFIDITEGV